MRIRIEKEKGTADFEVKILAETAEEALTGLSNVNGQMLDIFNIDPKDLDVVILIGDIKE